MMDSNTTLWAVEFANTEGDETSHLFDSTDDLGNFVRVNAIDAAWFRISAVAADALARARIIETFDED